MGLSIHIQLHLPKDGSPARAEAMVREARALATQLARRRRIGARSVSPVIPAEALPHCLQWVLFTTADGSTTGIEVHPIEGWCFAVQPGDDSEAAVFGLCRYPATVVDADGRRRRTKCGQGWSFSSSCKTQYASNHGWPHFLRSHRVVIDIARLWEGLGAEVAIDDEGGYWPGRDTKRLRANLATLNAAVAGLAGALKDAAEESGGPPVTSPIFEHPQFEHLEAEGVTRFEKQIRAAQLFRQDEPEA